MVAFTSLLAAADCRFAVVLSAGDGVPSSFPARILRATSPSDSCAAQAPVIAVAAASASQIHPSSHRLRIPTKNRPLCAHTDSYMSAKSLIRKATPQKRLEKVAESPLCVPQPALSDPELAKGESN